jgi:hypothetical protein
MSTITRALVAAAFAASSVLAAGGQNRDAGKIVATGTAQIAGTIVSGDASPVPIRRATLTLIGERNTIRLVAVTDDAGAFAFTSLPADRYSLQVAKAGYVPMNYGSKRPGGSGTPIVASEGQRLTVAMTLLRGSVITGTVRDDRGRALPDVTVTALRYAVSFQTGERTLQSVAIGSAGQGVANYAPDAFPGTAVTDDRGMYRIYGLAPGEYVLAASARPPGSSPLVSTDVHQISDADVQRAQQLLRGSSLGPSIDAGAGTARSAGASRVDYAPVYHPAAISGEDAATVTLGPSEERSGIDVLLRLVPTASVSGILSALDGTPRAGAQVTLIAPSPSSTRLPRITRSNPDGEFVIAGIAPGRYQIQAFTYPEGLFGSSHVLVEGRDVEASLVLEPGVTMSGRVVFDGAAPRPASNAVPLLLSRQPSVIGGRGFQMSPDGRFVFSRIVPGTYTLRINGRPPAGWALRSVMVNGADGSDIPFEIKPNVNIEGVVITLTDRPAEISGVLQNAAGEPAPDYVLIVFSADPRHWVPRTRRTQQVRPDISGRFIARDLPAGDYLIAAVTDLEDGQWNDPAFLAALAASSPVKITLAEGDRKVQDIRIGR